MVRKKKRMVETKSMMELVVGRLGSRLARARKLFQYFCDNNTKLHQRTFGAVPEEAL